MERADLTPDVLDRFIDKVEIQASGCWLWMGYVKTTGYGSFFIYGMSPQLAHRVAYTWLVGPIPEGLTLDHLCRNRHCVNPGHLEVVTTTENILRGQSPFAINARKTHCKHGHEFTPENTYHRPASGRPGRHCRACAVRV